jgi:hypothetical protein
VKHLLQRGIRLGLLLSVILALIDVVPALAQGANPLGVPQPPQRPGSPPLPTVIDHGPPLGIVLTLAQSNAAGRVGAASGNLAYHNGPVLPAGNHVHAIYWFPSGSTYSVTYQTLINQYFTDVAASNNASTNVYYSDDQYYNYNHSQTINYTPTFSPSADVYVDTNAFPASGCTDSSTPICLSDAQLQQEILSAIATNGKGWSVGVPNIYFIFTPQGVGSCAGSYCAYSYYCAYHSWATVQTSPTTTQYLLYANMPYAAGYDCNTTNQPKPNGDDADYTINVTSHEHNEAITDPEGNAWYDRRGYEDGDKCAWNFGTATYTAPNGQPANQLIGTHYYYLQQEWSNASSRCVLTGK